jgi:hypothetical protein
MLALGVKINKGNNPRIEPIIYFSQGQQTQGQGCCKLGSI